MAKAADLEMACISLLGFIQSGHLFFMKAPSTPKHGLQIGVLKHFSSTNFMSCKKIVQFFHVCIYYGNPSVYTHYSEILTCGR